jgi:hypothetical protein
VLRSSVSKPRPELAEGDEPPEDNLRKVLQHVSCPCSVGFPTRRDGSTTCMHLGQSARICAGVSAALSLPKGLPKGPAQERTRRTEVPRYERENRLKPVRSPRQPAACREVAVEAPIQA